MSDADTIKENSQNPQSVASDGVNVRQHSIRDQIEADKYANAKDAVKQRRRGILITQLVPPGSA